MLTLYQIAMYRPSCTCSGTWNLRLVSGFAATISEFDCSSFKGTEDTALRSKTGDRLKSFREGSECLWNCTFAALARANVLSSTGSTKAMRIGQRSEEHTSELQSLLRISYAVFCLKNKKN